MQHVEFPITQKFTFLNFLLALLAHPSLPLQDKFNMGKYYERLLHY